MKKEEILEELKIWFASDNCTEEDLKELQKCIEEKEKNASGD